MYPPDDSIIIFDTGADQCSIGGPAWTILHDTGDKVKCNGYLKGEYAQNGPVLPIVSGVTCVKQNDGDDFLIIVHQALYYNDKSQNESLILPFQAEQHGVKFSLTPTNRLDTNDTPGRQNMIIEHKEIPLNFDGRKLYLNIRKPTDSDYDTLQTYEITSPENFVPDPTTNKTSYRRLPITEQNNQYPGGL